MKVFTSLWLILTFFFGSLRFGFQPTVILDLEKAGPPIGNYAAGNLYGLAETGVPSEEMVKSLDLSVLAQKVPGGLQHPTGDLDHVAGMAENADHLVVYLQDVFSSWYYAHGEIEEMRRAGTYDPETFLHETFYPLLTPAVETLAAAPYADKVVLCPYNECDNGVWFGEWIEGENGPWAAFNEAGRNAFFAAWKETFDLLRSLAPDLKIGGPGYCDYSLEKETDFLTFCKENGCVPDVMIWHELSDTSSLNWTAHVARYRALEENLGLSPLPVFVTEYGTMAECGAPAAMLRYIAAMEESETYGCIAYWRLANNLNENTADDNMPNACWWLYRWYAELSGRRVPTEVNDLFHADFAKAVKENRPLRVKSFSGLAAADPAAEKAELICACDHALTLRVKNLSAVTAAKKVRVQIEAVTFSGLAGVVPAPVRLTDRELRVTGDQIKLKLPATDAEAVYHVTVSPATGSAGETAALPARFECETGTLLGQAYTYRSAYPSTGEEAGLVGGMERPGDGVKMEITVPRAGDYDLGIVYGKANDGASPADRVSGKAALRVNGEERLLTLPNTVRSEYTSLLRITATLNKGKNTLVFSHASGTFVLDSVLVSPQEESGAVALIPDLKRTDETHTGFLAVAPDNGCYLLETTAQGASLDGVPCAGRLLYLKRGLNSLVLNGKNAAGALIPAETDTAVCSISPNDLALSGAAEVKNGALTGITSEGGAARACVTVPAAGDYRLTFTYSNNQEGGLHDYNVDLIEAYFTVTLNGKTHTLMCRNTYSDENRSTVTLDAPLSAGENPLVLSNDGSVRFADRTAAAPLLYNIEVYPVCTEAQTP